MIESAARLYYSSRGWVSRATSFVALLSGCSYRVVSFVMSNKWVKGKVSFVFLRGAAEFLMIPKLRSDQDW